MKKLFLTTLLALPLNAMSEEVADTTFTYNGKQYTVKLTEHREKKAEK